MNFSLNSLYEQPFTVLNGLSQVQGSPLSDPSVIVRDGARKLYTWWADYVARHDKLPTRNSFDILTMLPHAANMFLAARLPDGGWTYQLQGEDFKRLFNGGFQSNEAINRSFAAFTQPVSEYLDSVAAARTCHRNFGKVSVGVQKRNTFEAIDCPLIDAGGSVSHMIGIAELFRGANAQS
ncbi:hypothetical protein [Hwanghaeella sp.]|uniref:hypothetical protein n=1 Tax=Hwanghaeella sp. TaxID=2605943 RepID=UPI003CCBE29E